MAYGISEREAYMLTDMLGQMARSFAPRPTDFGFVSGTQASQTAQDNIARIAREEAEEAAEKEGEVFGLDLGPVGKPLATAAKIGSTFIPVVGPFMPMILEAADQGLTHGKISDPTALAMSAIPAAGKAASAIPMVNAAGESTKFAQAISKMPGGGKILDMASKANMHPAEVLSGMSYGGAQGAQLRGGPAGGKASTPYGAGVEAAKQIAGPAVGAAANAENYGAAGNIPNSGISPTPVSTAKSATTKSGQIRGAIDAIKGSLESSGYDIGSIHDLQNVIASEASTRSLPSQNLDTTGLTQERAQALEQMLVQREALAVQQDIDREALDIRKQRMKLEEKEFGLRERVVKKELDDAQKPIVELLKGDYPVEVDHDNDPSTPPQVRVHRAAQVTQDPNSGEVIDIKPVGEGIVQQPKRSVPSSFEAMAVQVMSDPTLSDEERISALQSIQIADETINPLKPTAEPKASEFDVWLGMAEQDVLNELIAEGVPEEMVYHPTQPGLHPAHNQRVADRIRQYKEGAAGGSSVNPYEISVAHAQDLKENVAERFLEGTGFMIGENFVARIVNNEHFQHFRSNIQSEGESIINELIQNAPTAKINLGTVSITKIGSDEIPHVTWYENGEPWKREIKTATPFWMQLKEEYPELLGVQFNNSSTEPVGAP